MGEETSVPNLFPGQSSLNLYGGGLAAVHAMGAIRFLVPRSKITFIDSVSAGAIIGAILISHDFNVEKLIEIWLEVDKIGAEKIFRTNNLVNIRRWWGKALYDNDGVREIIDKYVDAEKIINWDGEFIVVTTNITRGRKVPFSNKDKNLKENPSLLKDAILASASLGGLLPPVLIEGEWYKDGFTCSLVASLEREMDNIFVVLNSRLDEGAGEHHENDSVLYQALGNIRDVVRDKVVADLKHIKRNGYRLIEQNPTNMFDDVKSDPKSTVRNLVKDTLEAFNPLNTQPLEERSLGKRKSIVFTPTNPVMTLKTDKFYKGDMKIAIDRSMKEVEEFSQRLEKEL